MKYADGDIIYFINSYIRGVQFGIVVEEFSSEVQIAPLYLQKVCYINGKPADTISLPSRWRKLPKGWKYDTELIKIKYIHPAAKYGEINITSKESLMKAYEDGILVKGCDMRDRAYDTEITKDGWRVVENLTYYKCHPSCVSVQKNMCFDSFEEANKMINEYYRELERQSNLTDEEWAIEQIDKVIGRALNAKLISQDDMVLYRERLLSMDNIDKLEVRFTTSGVEYKYDGHKKWSAIA